MPLCRDPLVTLLNSFNFNAVRVPRNDYRPGSVLVRSDGSVSLLGAFDEVFSVASKEALPVTDAGAVAAFEGATSARYRGAIAARLLAEWFGAGSPSAASSVSGADRISYQIQQTRLLSTTVSAVLRLLADAAPSPALLQLEGARLFVITEVLQAKGLVVSAGRGAAGTLALDASLVPGTSARGTATVELDAGSASSGMLRLTFADYQTIGFKAHEVEIADGDYRLSPALKRGLSHMATTPEEYEPIVFDAEPLL
ncbi:MAG TPA: hypothetical protein VFN10_19280 [Thermoanaerobaculia bacterium]|nr:hypothetical protein [Thermoanaerobaculia bacterium]